MKNNTVIHSPSLLGPLELAFPGRGSKPEKSMETERVGVRDHMEVQRTYL